MERQKKDAAIPRTWFKRNEFGLIFGFCFVSIHVIWYNLQRSHVPLEERTEIKVFAAAIKKWNEMFQAKQV